MRLFNKFTIMARHPELEKNKEVKIFAYLPQQKVASKILQKWIIPFLYELELFSSIALDEENQLNINVMCGFMPVMSIACKSWQDVWNLIDKYMKKKKN